MTPAIKSIGSAAMVVVFVAGGGALAYARWTRPVAEADRALADDRFEPALAGYARAEARFDQAPAAKPLFAAEYDRPLETRAA